MSVIRLPVTYCTNTLRPSPPTTTKSGRSRSKRSPLRSPFVGRADRSAVGHSRALPFMAHAPKSFFPTPVQSLSGVRRCATADARNERECQLRTDHTNERDRDGRVARQLQSYRIKTYVYGSADAQLKCQGG